MTERISLLAGYSFLKNPQRWGLLTPEIRYFSAILRRREVLLGDALREENCLEEYLMTDTPAGIISSCRRMAQLLRKEVRNIERQIKAHTKAAAGGAKNGLNAIPVLQVGTQRAKLDLKFGVALTATINGQTVIVPKVYLSPKDVTVQNGSVISSNNLQLAGGGIKRKKKHNTGYILCRNISVSTILLSV